MPSRKFVVEAVKRNIEFRYQLQERRPKSPNRQSSWHQKSSTPHYHVHPPFLPKLNSERLTCRLRRSLNRRTTGPNRRASQPSNRPNHRTSPIPLHPSPTTRSNSLLVPRIHPSRLQHPANCNQHNALPATLHLATSPDSPRIPLQPDG